MLFISLDQSDVMKWCCFLFWFIWRLTLACLAHFNWGMALYTNCIYFVIWKVRWWLTRLMHLQLFWVIHFFLKRWEVFLNVMGNALHVFKNGINSQLERKEVICERLDELQTYDILWFWMHLILCSCFESLRRENYLLVWWEIRINDYGSDIQDYWCSFLGAISFVIVSSSTQMLRTR